MFDRCGVEQTRFLIEVSAQAIEVLAVAIIVIGIVYGTIRYLFHINRQVGGPYEQYKAQVGKALLLGLEFLVAGDIIRTVVLELTLQNVMILGLLVIVRTFLSWSLVVEIKGRWPWRGAEGRGTESVEGRGSADE